MIDETLKTVTQSLSAEMSQMSAKEVHEMVMEPWLSLSLNK